jgi:hypothetical protein
MGQAYFNALYDWLRDGGAAIVTDWLMNYPIERGAIPMRAPDTSSTQDAITMSRTPVERCVIEAVEDGVVGFRGGWVSSWALVKRIKEAGVLARAPQIQTIKTVLEGMGYVDCGRAPQQYFEEERQRPYLFHAPGIGDVSAYGRAQGYLSV